MSTKNIDYSFVKTCLFRKKDAFAYIRVGGCGKPGVAGRRLSPAVGVRGSPFGAGARGILPPFLYIKESYPTIAKISYIVG